MSSLIGRRLGRYEIRAELGRGGMARVYRALDTTLQRQIALKVLAAQLSLDDEFVRRFEREATTAGNLRHHAIVTIYDVGEQDGLYYIAMEYVAGRSLHAILEERITLGLGFAISLLDPVAQALDYAHAKGAVHRDIKPHNILIGHDGRVLLTDFGIAQTTESSNERLTRTGIFMGTPEYIAPEQAEAGLVDGRSDLYALAIVAYELITGRVPFSGSTPQLIVAHAQLPPPPPTSIAAHLPSDLDPIFARALAKRPEERFASGSAFVANLREVAQRYGTPLASRDQVAGLATASGELPRPSIPEPIPAPPPPRPRSVKPPPTPPASSAGQTTTREDLGLVPPARPPAPVRPPSGSGAARPVTIPPRSQRLPPQPGSQLPMLFIGLLLVGVTIGFLVLVSRGFAGPIQPVPPSGFTASPTTSNPTTVPVLVETLLPSVTPTPTAPSPTVVLPSPTREVPPPTLVPPRPPTAAPPPDPSATPAGEPSATTEPTETAVPTETTEPTETAAPTETAIPTETAEPTETTTPTKTPTPEPTAIFNNTPMPVPVITTP
ncbi:MAG: serine/threonine protein kinase [Candidatus Viridilinea halotolerans]|uniref:non-specific serine/threonine protein kinase n=1 Tax=Candidatus Viridilinea halotolerans TaxID=2491704 RepID=A0A426U241_9CHLR|nr:MAG: serine/threonine protein kinase [Candidatus Viridilinea halotolerans]